MRAHTISDTCFDRVRHALAEYLHLRRDPIALEHRLGEDLGLHPLDLVLVVLDLEELVDAEFPMAELDGVLTVEDLVKLVSSWSTATISNWDTLPPPARVSIVPIPGAA